MKQNVVTVILIALLLAFTSPSKGQLQSKKFNDNYKVLAQKETENMKVRYRLSAAQLSKVSDLNQAYYADINHVLQTNKDRLGRKEAVRVVREKREIKLKLLFTKAQYTAYRKDMDAVELKARQRVDDLNKNAVKKRIQLKN